MDPRMLLLPLLRLLPLLHGGGGGYATTTKAIHRLAPQVGGTGVTHGGGHAVQAPVVPQQQRVRIAILRHAAAV